jgi:trans-aconitate 2-methyltransferase
MTDFTSISNRYEKDSLVQKSAGDVLLELADVQPADDVLDLGCGAGNLTRLLRERTRGNVVGIDESEGMIHNAAEKYGKDIRFFSCRAEDMAFHEEFDLIFCNSTFQWFRDPDHILAKCLDALRPGGRMVIQSPARRDYSPTFLNAIAAVADDPRTRRTFSEFHSPWLFLETEEAYRAIFEKVRFRVTHAKIETNVSRHTPEEAYRIFDSGASAGYLNPDYYASPWPEGYAESFGKIVSQNFKQQAEGGTLNLIFNRIFLKAVRPGLKIMLA